MPLFFKAKQVRYGHFLDFTFTEAFVNPGGENGGKECKLEPATLNIFRSTDQLYTSQVNKWWDCEPRCLASSKIKLHYHLRESHKSVLWPKVSIMTVLMNESKYINHWHLIKKWLFASEKNMKVQNLLFTKCAL